MDSSHRPAAATQQHMLHAAIHAATISTLLWFEEFRQVKMALVEEAVACSF